MRRQLAHLGRTPDECEDSASTRSDALGVAQGLAGVGGVLEGVEAGDSVERVIGERQRLKLALDDRRVRGSPAGVFQEPGRGVET